jgi:lipopolysaccharide transport system ATP-binding protein
MTIAIKLENVSKQYRLGVIGTGTIAHDLNRWWALMRGKEDPYSKVGETNAREQSATGEYVWALKDVNLEVERGTVLGIIGRNGAGKSTLLKLLSRVTAPTTGLIKARGRIASLLEVGTGFHPELTGRENIYMNGAVLGMRRFEITERLDAIVEFSGCQKYLDTPVKRYSSGMTVRLGFAVAAHLNCETLIVDEVLAVGDLDFQSKCIGKMKEVSQSGRTVLFVSHNMNSVSHLTEHAAVLHEGRIYDYGETNSMIAVYRNLTGHAATQNRGSFETEPEDRNMLVEAVVKTSLTEARHVCKQPCEFEFTFEVKSPSPGLCFSFQIIDELDRPVAHFWLFDDNRLRHQPGRHTLVARVPALRLFSGKYSLSTYLSERSMNQMQDHRARICEFEIVMDGLHRPNYPWKKGDCVYLEDFEWIDRSPHES